MPTVIGLAAARVAQIMQTESLEISAGVRAPLSPIPVVETGPDFPMATLLAFEDLAHALLDRATRHVPRAALHGADLVSRRWLEKSGSAHLGEIDAIAARLKRPGAYFLSVNYEWGCTVGVKPGTEGSSARLVRVLDWRTPGLGRFIIAARVNGGAGPFVSMTWPGYTGVLQAMAPGRFAASLNQAPMRESGGWYPLDWAVNRHRVWRMPHPTPAHLLRQAFETCATFDEAKRLLASSAIASPGIFSLAGLAPHETCVIERRETTASVHDGPSVAANHWQAAGWHGRPRGIDSVGRSRMMHGVSNDFDTSFSWFKPPILNDRTRLVMIADASLGRLIAQGYEADGQATLPLDLCVEPAAPATTMPIAS